MSESAPPSTASSPHQPSTQLAPAASRRLARIDASGAEPVRDAVATATAAQPFWSRADRAERSGFLARLGQQLAAQRESLSETIASEIGATATQALVDEIEPLVWLCAALADASRDVPVTRDAPASGLLARRDTTVRPRARGVLAVFSAARLPFSAPLGIALTALATGHAVIVKPGPGTGHSLLAARTIFANAGLPEGLFSVLPGDANTARSILDAGVARVAFVGREASARGVGALCGERGIAFGRGPRGRAGVLVCDDADLDLAAQHIVRSGFFSGGRTPGSIARVMVHGSIYHALLDRLATHSRRWIQVHTSNAEGRWMMASERQRSLARELRDDALAGGARVLADASDLATRSAHGGPAVLVDCATSARILREECFAPQIAVARVLDEAAGVRQLAATPVACASVYARDLDRARALAAEIAADSVRINEVFTGSLALDAPGDGTWLCSPASMIYDPHATALCRSQRVESARLPWPLARILDAFGDPFAGRLPKALARLFRSHTGIASPADLP